MAGTMKAAVLVKPQKFEIHERPIPKPSAGEVLIRVSRCGICGTDIHIFNGHYAFPYFYYNLYGNKYFTWRCRHDDHGDTI